MMETWCQFTTKSLNLEIEIYFLSLPPSHPTIKEGFMMEGW